jgi:hypothetical protein
VKIQILENSYFLHDLDSFPAFAVQNCKLQNGLQTHENLNNDKIAWIVLKAILYLEMHQGNTL